MRFLQTFAFFLFPLIVFASEQLVQTKFTDVAQTPPMGWNSWNAFGCNIDEEIIRGNAKAMVQKGMREAGYEYLIVDDCWQAPARDENGDLVADPKRFPGGMKALADYVHSLGLKFGIYSDAGPWTCKGLPGSYGNEERDAQVFASWGVDYLKYDRCYTLGMDARTLYTRMAKAIVTAKRPMVFAICNWGHQECPLWAPEIGHSWRTTWDILNHWRSVLWILDTSSAFGAVAKPGQWNDPDMLQVGNGNLTRNQAETHFALWSMMAAPLIAGNDLRSMDEETRQILTNEGVIAINQDSLGQQGTRIGSIHGVEVWSKELAGPDHPRAILFFNRRGEEAHISIPVDHLGFNPFRARVKPILGEVGISHGVLSAQLEIDESKIVIISGELALLSGARHWLEDVVPSYEASAKGAVRLGESVDGHSLTINGNVYAHGIGLHAPAKLRYKLNGECRVLEGLVGVDDEALGGSLSLEVYGDDRLLWKSPEVSGKTFWHRYVRSPEDHKQEASFSIDVQGVQVLELKFVPTKGTSSYAHADLVDTVLECR